MHDLLREFLTETSENLDILDVELVKLEDAPHDGAILAAIFRVMHTIKGTCGFLGLSRLEALIHAAEDVLDHYRGGAPITCAGISLLLQSVDRIRHMLAHIEEAGAEPAASDSDLIAQLHALIRCDKQDPRSALEYPSLSEIEALERASRATPGPNAAHMPVHGQGPASGEMNGSELAGPAARIRLQPETLQHLMELAGELDLTRAELIETARLFRDTRLDASLLRLSIITDELQSALVEARRQPLDSTWRKLLRLVRDLCRDLGKPIALETHGGDIELDRRLLDCLKDPLIHLIRNCADHGLEDAETRRRLGKPDEGRISLRASREGGCVVIEIADDGRGLDANRIRASAARLGLIGTDEPVSLSDGQVGSLAFHPGLSTATERSPVSGRGVGLDVVRSNIERIGGSVALRSVAGEGTTVTMKIPLILAPPSAARSDNATTGRRRALLVDDCSFFHALLTPIIIAAGYHVALAASMPEALQRLAQEGPFDAVIADIDLPQTGAHALAQVVHSAAGAQNAILIGLASRLTDAVMAQARQTGFSHLVGKFDRLSLRMHLEAPRLHWARAA